MSIDLVSAALWLPLEPNRKLVLLSLCERADLTTGRCWPGREEVAARCSLTPRRVSPHFVALETDGWIRSRKGNARAGQTTTRWVNVKRILTDGEASRMAFVNARAERLASLSDDSSPDQIALALGDDDDLSGDVAVTFHVTEKNDQVTPATLSGDAVTLVTVIEPSDQPSIEPSTQPSYARERAEPDVGGPSLRVFADALRGRMLPVTAERLLENAVAQPNGLVVLRVTNVQLARQLEPSDLTGRVLREKIAMCATEAGFKGFEMARG